MSSLSFIIISGEKTENTNRERRRAENIKTSNLATSFGHFASSLIRGDGTRRDYCANRNIRGVLRGGGGKKEAKRGGGM